MTWKDDLEIRSGFSIDQGIVELDGEEAPANVSLNRNIALLNV
jgi:hypothetical protein